MYKYVYSKPGRNDDADGDELDIKLPFAELDKKPYKQYDQTFTAQHIHYYLSKGIGAAEEYTDMIHRITMASPSDVIFIHLNTPGGQIDTGVQIVNAMKNSQAKIVTILEATAYSLGTLIFLAGDEMVVNDNCMMMFHNFNGGLVGKGNELVSELEATVKWFQSLAQDIYIPFLTQEEYMRIVRGEDMWMQTPEIRTRLEHMVEVLNKKSEEEAAAEEEAEIAAITEALAELTAEKKIVAKKTAPKKVATKKKPGRKPKSTATEE